MSATTSIPESQTHNPSADVQWPRVAYMMSRFPKLTETFVLNEIAAAQHLGVPVEIFPLRREPADVQQPEVQDLLPVVHFTNWLSLSMLGSMICFAFRRPLRFWGTAWTLLRANFGSLRFLAAAVLYFPKACHLSRLMRRRGIQHIHAHFCSHPTMVAFVIHRLTDISFSFTAHGSDLHVDRHMLKEKVARASLAVTISEYNRQLILRECGDAFSDKVVVVHCGIDPAKFKPSHGETEFDRGGPFQIVCTGTLHEVKGQAYLLEAIAILGRRDIVCHLIGDGEDRSSLEALAKRLGLEEQVVFHGRCDRHEVFAILSRMDAAVCPSVRTTKGQREGIPVALMEAMAVGVPVIGSELSGIPELIEDDVTGLLTTPKAPHTIADALRRLIESADLREKLTANAHEKIENEFNLTQSTRQLFQLLRGRLAW